MPISISTIVVGTHLVVAVADRSTCVRHLPKLQTGYGRDDRSFS